MRGWQNWDSLKEDETHMKKIQGQVTVTRLWWEVSVCWGECWVEDTGIRDAQMGCMRCSRVRTLQSRFVEGRLTYLGDRSLLAHIRQLIFVVCVFGQ